MAPNSSNITHYLKSEDWMFVPASHYISWFAVLGIVCLATVILNIITIIVCEAAPAAEEEYILDHPSSHSRSLGWGGYRTSSD